MSNLLQVNRMRPKVALQGKNMPLWMDLPVEPATAPYLVSSARKGVLWVEDAQRGDEGQSIIRAGVQRLEAPGILFAQILAAVIERSLKDQWGSVLPYSEDGLRLAVAHIESYDLSDLEALVSKKPEGDDRPKWLKTTLAELNIPARTTSWLPDNCILIVPRDRAFVGMLNHLDMKTVAALVHNAARGMAVAIGVSK